MVTQCIDAIFEQKYTDYDLFVVDNASDDDSVLRIEEYAGRLTLLKNKENLGGSGGFNRGLRYAYDIGYEFLMCVDNDALLDEGAVGALVDFLDNHPECGMAASKIYNLEEPDVVQNYGQTIDFKYFCTEANYYGCTEDGSMPDFLYVDAVPACSLMVRRSTIEKIGFLPEENFLYWDDTEWGYKCNLSGLKVASVGASKALHSMGARKEDVNTFPTYYAWRNWIRFFIKYTPEDMLVDMAATFLNSVFEVQYEGFIREEFQKAVTVSSALWDALFDKMGKASEGRIGPVDINPDIPMDLEIKKTGEDYEKSRDVFIFSNIQIFLREAYRIRETT